MSTIKVPFTPEQVEALNEYQQLGWAHPFTCCSHDGCNRSDRPDNGVLVAYQSGWICPCGKYKQDWAHSYMGEKQTEPDWFSKMQTEKTIQMKAEQMIDIGRMAGVYNHLYANNEIFDAIQVADDADFASVCQAMLDDNVDAVKDHFKTGVCTFLEGEPIPVNGAVKLFYLPPFYLFQDLKKEYK